MPGFRAWPPVNTPVFSRSPTLRDTRSRDATAVRYATTSARCSAVTNWSTSGCSGASTMKVAPNSVSGRVVKTRIGSPAVAANSISAPSLRPIQLRCAVAVVSDQSIFDGSSRWASSRSA